ncbi:protein phosphatase 1A-like isoform X2 [Photinus pyralis]|uniref:protein phosphatase 1A-like isoform X2 n=1 Tax=Photinus pyralis TaxID=7054 RepID=UPI0012676D9D|nr:protein phosphatase 1A-like isoform X2 [Photinus pyralis]XP_031327672.1 protein phosphatase 1A-like isoform X2 [Photinus pyralis]
MSNIVILQGSRDNMSIVLVVFPGAPTPSQEAIQAEQELDAIIERSIKEVVSNEGQVSFMRILELFVGMGLEGLPPGGGLAAKRALMAEIYRELCPKQDDSDSDECMYS